MKKITQKFFFSLFAVLVAFPIFSHNEKVLLAPTIASFSPTSGVTGTTVNITGSNFSTALSANTVTFNGTAAIVTAATPNILTVVVPAGASTGAVHVSIGADNATSSSVFTVLSSTSCNGISNNNAKNWYFGNQAAMVFESNGPVAVTNSAMSQVEGVASMSDANGNLLFYTNGITIYNRNHVVMENGNGLLSNSSNTQAAFVVPFPGNPNQYFVITPSPYYYSIVDMTLDNGNGAILPTSKNILITNETSEKVAGLLTSNQTDIWLVTYASGQKRFNTYRITPSGINTTPVVSQFTIASGYYGYMKISPDQTRIVTANFDNNFHLYDFNPVTGIVSNQKVINYSFGGHGTYGIEFSPNSNLVYAADHRGQNKIVQFDITLSTPELIAASAVALAANPRALGALQLGPDNKIYLAKENSPFLGVINNPNVIGSNCNFVVEGVDLGGKTSNLGLPGFVASSLVKSEPYITAFSPVSANVGAAVTISGINFNTTPSNNMVTFNGVSAVVTSATTTSLTVTVPNGATTGKISVEIGCGLVATTANFTVTSLGVNEFSDAKIAVFPNPSSGIFNIQLQKSVPNAAITVSDLNGRIVFQSKAQNLKEHSLNLGGLQSGMYILKIDSAGQHFSQKLLKQ